MIYFFFQVMSVYNLWLNYSKKKKTHSSVAKWFYVTDVVVKQNRVLVKGCMTPLKKRKEREKKKTE